ncbi:FG-GAP repeat protein, partial [Magnetospirillum fulvum]
NTALVGANAADPGGISNAGAAYVFTRSGGTWTQQAKLTASDKAANDWFGFSVSLSSDGNTAVVGAYQADPGGISGAGAAYVFVRSGGTWTEQTKLTASDKAVGDWFGSSVSLSSDGNTAVVGAYIADPSGVFNAGAVYIIVQ